ncbi:sensor histidine kinase [Streptomyces katsurahamanus]|uniref:sensor histidine kinase n=1 Tax=Streptomyces katsurahamanus TaxID=2577098 RepID=UPI00389A5699
MPGRDPGPKGLPDRLPRRPRRRLPLRKSLLGRLLAVSALVAFCSVAATAWLAVQTTSGAIEEQQGQNLSDGARIYDRLREHAATRPDWDGVERTVRELAARYDRRIALTTEDHRTLADSARAPGGGPADSPPPALPPEASAVVDPLASDTALDLEPQGGGGDAKARIDPRAVGPFRVTGSERTGLERRAERAVDCLKGYGVAADVVRTPSGRPRIQIVGESDDDLAEGLRCGLAELAEPTPTEAKALAALNKLSDACLKRTDHDPVRLNLDLSWARQGVRKPSMAVEPRATVLLSEPSPSAQPAEPAEPAELGFGDSTVDRAVASCVDTARREQLSPHVSPAALLFIGDADGTPASGFDLSAENTARIVGVAALVLALTVGATLLAATRLVRPLHALTGAAQRMKDGERSEPVPVTADNEIGRLAAAFNDMAAHRARLETQRRAMVSDVAHELRTPLSNIRGWLEGAQDGVAEPDEAFVSSLLEEAVQLQHIIDDLQDLAESDAGALRLHPGPVAVAELLGQVAAAQQARAETAGVALRVRAADGLPQLTADPVRLRQAVGNLVSNAVRHTPPGGTVTLRAYDSGERPGQWLAVAVADTGEGITAENLPHVFDRFWRAEKSRNRRMGGSGLGLAIVRNLTEAHGGTVTAASEPGKGAEFTLRLPVRPGPLADRDAGPGVGAAGVR